MTRAPGLRGSSRSAGAFGFLFSPLTRRRALSLPITGRRRKNRTTARRLRRAVQGVGSRAPDGIVRRHTMGFERRLIPVDFVKVIDVRVLLIMQNIEPQAARFIALGAQSIDLDRL